MVPACAMMTASGGLARPAHHRPGRLRPRHRPRRSSVDLSTTLTGMATPRHCGAVIWQVFPRAAVRLIRAAARSAEVVALAKALGIDPMVAVSALLARAAGGSNRSAERLPPPRPGAGRGAR